MRGSSCVTSPAYRRVHFAWRIFRRKTVQKQNSFETAVNLRYRSGLPSRNYRRERAVSLKAHLLRHRRFVFSSQVSVGLYRKNAAAFVAEPAANGYRKDEELIEITESMRSTTSPAQTPRLARKARGGAERAPETSLSSNFSATISQLRLFRIKIYDALSRQRILSSTCSRGDWI